MDSVGCTRLCLYGYQSSIYFNNVRLNTSRFANNSSHFSFCLLLLTFCIGRDCGKAKAHAAQGHEVKGNGSLALYRIFKRAWALVCFG